MMEPFLSPDGGILFFNNLNAPPENTNLHWSTQIDDNSFKYEGEVDGVNTADLEGVATMDQNKQFYFVSTRNYDQTLSTVYTGLFANGMVTGVLLVPNISLNTNGWLNFDVEVDFTGNYLYLVDGRFDQNGGPYEADLFLAEKTSTGFTRSTSDPFVNVNTPQLEYAACISRDNLELYFTRLETPISSSSQPKIYGTYRASLADDFLPPVKIDAATGFVEGPTLSLDGNTLYFHKAENGKFVLYTIRKL